MLKLPNLNYPDYPNYEEQKLVAKYLAKELKIKLRFCKLNSGGMYNTDNHTIFIDLDNTWSPLSTFFHELGHWFAHITGKWKSYHYTGKIKSKKHARAIKLTALKAERWVDKWGETQFKKLFPLAHYSQCYRDEEDAKWLKIYIGKEIGKFYARKSKNRKARSRA